MKVKNHDMIIIKPCVNGVSVSVSPNVTQAELYKDLVVFTDIKEMNEYIRIQIEGLDDDDEDDMRCIPV